MVITSTGTSKAAATYDFSVHNRFDFDLLAIVFEAELSERLPKAIAKLSVLVQIDDLLASL
jgi:hypothetical protein